MSRRPARMTILSSRIISTAMHPGESMPASSSVVIRSQRVHLCRARDNQRRPSHIRGPEGTYCQLKRVVQRRRSLVVIQSVESPQANGRSNKGEAERYIELTFLQKEAPIPHVSSFLPIARF